ncbi:MAG: hypothetical protein II943_04635 [Victivallales bacterium]|nr:hypothetical protein [Victivallales bacterium]
MPISESNLLPNEVVVEFEGGMHVFSRPSSRMTYKDIVVDLIPNRPDEPARLEIGVAADKSALMALTIRWEHSWRPSMRFLGNVWGEMEGRGQWRTMDPMRPFPWYVLGQGEESARGLGVLAQPGGFAVWRVNPSTVQLRLDLRCGDRGVVLAGRRLLAAVVVYRRYERTPLAASRDFCAELSSAAILPSLPVYGQCDGHFYRGTSTARSILSDAGELAKLSNGLTNPPFQVVDPGWESIRNGEENPCGPWTHGNANFPDMAALAEDIKAKGVRPGIALRLLCDASAELPERWRQQRNPHLLDPSVPEVLEHVREDIRRMSDWGFDLIKHVNSTRDCLGNYLRPGKRDVGWSFADRSRTSAEIIVDFYRAIKSAMGDTLILGTDIVGQLGAGLLHMSRINPDEPDEEWQHALHNRVNALAFRYCQNGTCFMVDTGELEVSERQPWQRVKTFAELAACSGATFFLSIQPGKMTAKMRKELVRCFEIASMGDSQVVPLDWLNNTCPEDWEINGVPRHFDWYS